MKVLSKDADEDYTEILAIEGKIDKLVILVERYLQNLSNRDFTSIAMNFKIYRIKSEMEVQRKFQIYC